MPNPNYLGSALPTAEKPVRQRTANGDEDRISALEARLEELNNLLIKQQRDEQDYRDNIDEGNLSESLMNIIKDLQKRVDALEGQNP